MSDALGQLSNLQVLRLGYNRFYGGVSPKWAGMRSLRILDVRQNALTGVLPSVRLHSIRLNHSAGALDA